MTWDAHSMRFVQGDLVVCNRGRLVLYPIGHFIPNIIENRTTCYMVVRTPSPTSGWLRVLSSTLGRYHPQARSS